MTLRRTNNPRLTRNFLPGTCRAFLSQEAPMRLAAQMRGGYYPAHANAVAHAATFLRPPQNSSFAVLDPCAGTGAAIKQLANILGCPEEMTYAIELDDGRAEDVKAALPDAQVLAPASFFGCRASPNSFSFIWLNPPFDFSFGGHRVEDQFLQIATQWLMPGGVMALVCPENVIDDYSDARQHFMTYYENCTIEPFPAGDRPFKEVIVFGHKRARPNVNGKRDNTWETGKRVWQKVLAALSGFGQKACPIGFPLPGLL